MLPSQGFSWASCCELETQSAVSAISGGGRAALHPQHEMRGLTEGFVSGVCILEQKY